MDTKLNKLLTQVDDMEEMLQLMQRSHEMMLGQFKVKLEDLKQQVETLKNEVFYQEYWHLTLLSLDVEDCRTQIVNDVACD